MSAAQIDRSSRWIVKRLLKANNKAYIEIMYWLDGKVTCGYGKVVDNGEAVEWHGVKCSLSSFPTATDLLETLLLFGFKLVQVDHTAGAPIGINSSVDINLGRTVFICYQYDEVGTLDLVDQNYE